jgi:hypothetical protein
MGNPVPAKPTKDTTAVNIELPSALVERVRDFARRDMRSLKAEFVRALQLLLDTYDKPGAAPSASTLPLGTASAQTVRKETSSSFPINEQKFDKLIEDLKPSKHYRLFRRLAFYLQGGLSTEQILALETKTKPARVQEAIAYLEECATLGVQK